MTYLAPFRNRLLATALLVAGLLMFASSARAADTVYWANYGTNNVSFANLAGGGGGNLDVTGASAEGVNGVAIDSAAGRIYWVNASPPKVFYANLGGGGGGELSITGATTTGFLVGIAIDPAAGKVYWANGAEDKISYANLNGTGGGDLTISGATLDDPLGVAVDPTSGRIYWANGIENKISYAPLGGGVGADLNTTGATVFEPGGVAINTTAGRVYWANYNGSIAFANLNGTGGGNLPTTGATVEEPFGVAVDPTTGRVYWANEPGKISYASESGSGGADIDTSGVTLEGAAFPVLLKAPSPGSPPQASGASKPGSILSCTPGTWAPDLLESFLYRAPQSTSLQWLNNGQPIPGATASTFTASAVGNYSCQSTAVNHAGSTAQASASVAVFKLGKVKLNKKKGTATLTVQVPSAGTTTLSGKKVVKQKSVRKASSAGNVKLLVKAKGKAKKTLGKKGKVKIKATVAFTPASGSAGNQAKTLTLKKAKKTKKK